MSTLKPAATAGKKGGPPAVHVHHKFIIIDAETDHPTIFTGSNNLSNNSTHNNDESLLEITGSPRLAQTYFAEFMRLYEHYRARAIWNQNHGKGAKNSEERSDSQNPDARKNTQWVGQRRIQKGHAGIYCPYQPGILIEEPTSASRSIYGETEKDYAHTACREARWHESGRRYRWHSGKRISDCPGWQRAGALAPFFAPADPNAITPGIETPKFLFASGPVSKKQKEATGDGSKSFRPEQTITPLSELLGSDFPVNSEFAEGQEAQLAAFATGCDGVVLISWQHEEIPTHRNVILGKTGVFHRSGLEVDSIWSGYSISSQAKSIRSARFRRCC